MAGGRGGLTPPFDLGPFRAELRKREKELADALAQAKTLHTIAMLRLAVGYMREDLAKGKAALEPFTVTHPWSVGTPAWRWGHHSVMRATERLIPHARNPEATERLERDYEKYAKELRDNVRREYKVRFQSSAVNQIWVLRHNQATVEVVDRISFELDTWRRFHETDEDYLRIPPQEGVYRLLAEDRVDLLAMLRLAMEAGLNIRTIDLPMPERSTWEDTVEFAIGLIPIVGSLVAAYESWQGEDLFGRPLSDVDRGILGASVLLPAAGRLVKGGRAMYTAERLGRMYGPDAARNSLALSFGERASARANQLRKLESADGTVAGGKRLSKKAASEMTAVLRGLGLDDRALRTLAPRAVEARLTTALKALVKRHRFLADLDEYALERIAAKGTNIDHVKGQLLEELLETQVVKALRDSRGRYALGIALDPPISPLKRGKVPVPGPLEFIPGHLIRDVNGLQLTDGMIVRRAAKGEVLEVVAVFEAKSGKASARGLAAKSKSRTDLSAAERTELEAEARETLRELQERARLAGQPPPAVTVEQIMKDMKLTEAGGQIRTDLERLDQVGIFLNGRRTRLKVGPKSTKWFGVVPSDVNGKAQSDAIKKAGIRNVEVVGVDVTSKGLRDAAADIVKALGHAAAPGLAGCRKGSLYCPVSYLREEFEMFYRVREGSSFFPYLRTNADVDLYMGRSLRRDQTILTGNDMYLQFLREVPVSQWSEPFAAAMARRGSQHLREIRDAGRTYHWPLDDLGDPWTVHHDPPLGWVTAESSWWWHPMPYREHESAHNWWTLFTRAVRSTIPKEKRAEILEETVDIRNL